MVQLGDAVNTDGFTPDRSTVQDGTQLIINSSTSPYTNINGTYYVKKVADSEIPNSEGSNHAGENFELYTDSALTDKFLISELTWSTSTPNETFLTNPKDHDSGTGDSYKQVTISGATKNYHLRKIGITQTMTTNGYDIWDITQGDVRYLNPVGGNQYTVFDNFELQQQSGMTVSPKQIQFEFERGEPAAGSGNPSYYNLTNIKDTDPANYATTALSIDGSNHLVGYLFKEDDHFKMGKLHDNTYNDINDLGGIGWNYFKNNPELYINQIGSTNKWTMALSENGAAITMDDLLDQHWTYRVSWDDVADDRFNFAIRHNAMSTDLHNDMLFLHDKIVYEYINDPLYDNVEMTGTDDFVDFYDQLYYEYISADDNYKLYYDQAKTNQVTWPTNWLQQNQSLVGSIGPDDIYLNHTIKSRDGLDMLREPNLVTRPAGNFVFTNNLLHQSGDTNCFRNDGLKFDLATSFISPTSPYTTDDQYDGDTLYQTSQPIDFSGFTASVDLQTPTDILAYYSISGSSASTIATELAVFAGDHTLDRCISISDAVTLRNALSSKYGTGYDMNAVYTCYVPGHPGIRAFQMLDYMHVEVGYYGQIDDRGVYLRFFYDEGNFAEFSTFKFENFTTYGTDLYGNTETQKMYTNLTKVMPLKAGYLGETNTVTLSTQVDAIQYCCANFKGASYYGGAHWPVNGSGTTSGITADTPRFNINMDYRDMATFFIPEKDMFCRRHFDGYYNDPNGTLIPILRSGDSLPASTVDNPYYDNFCNGMLFNNNGGTYSSSSNNSTGFIRTHYVEGGTSVTVHKFDYKYYDEATDSVITHENITGKFMSLHNEETSNTDLWGDYNFYVPQTIRTRADNTNTDGTYDFTSTTMNTKFEMDPNMAASTSSVTTPTLHNDTVTYTRVPDRTRTDGDMHLSGIAENIYAQMLHSARPDDYSINYVELDATDVEVEMAANLVESTTGDIEEVYSHDSQFIFDEPANFSGTATVTPHTNETHPRYIASHTIELGGDQQFRRLDTNGDYENSIDWDNWYEPGDTDPEIAKARPDVGLGAFEGTVNQTLDTNSRLQSVTLGTMAQRGAYKATETEFVLNLYREDDLYVDPGAVDDGLQWQNFGNDDYKRWPNHIAPRAVSVNYNMPASSSTSPAGVKYSLPSGRYKWQIEVEYPPLTEEQFIEMQAVANAVSGTANPFWLYLKTNGNKWLFDTNISSTNKIRYRKEEIDNNTNTVIEAGVKNFLVDGFEGSEVNAFRAGDVIAAEDNINGSLNTVVNTVEANVFGEARITLASPLENDHFNGELIDTDPERCVVTLADGDFIYTKNTNGFFSLTVTFNLDKFED
jgi:hypothetical protein